MTTLQPINTLKQFKFVYANGLETQNSFGSSRYRISIAPVHHILRQVDCDPKLQTNLVARNQRLMRLKIVPYGNLSLVNAFEPSRFPIMQTLV